MKTKEFNQTRTGKSILDQQIELELGDRYTETLDRARRYVAATLNMYARWGRRGIILDSEGGRRGVLRNCLATVIEVGDVEEGLERWSRELAKEYANGPHVKWISYDDFFDDDIISLDDELGAPISKEIDVRPRELDSTIEYSTASSPKREALAYSGEPLRSSLDDFMSNGSTNDERVRQVIKTDEELELYKAIAATNNLADAANLIGMDVERARYLNNLVWQRVRYHEGHRGYHLSTG